MNDPSESDLQVILVTQLERAQLTGVTVTPLSSKGTPPGVRTPEHAPLRCKRSLGAGHGAGRFLFPWSEWTVPD
jgi:hypothetical protein